MLDDCIYNVAAQRMMADANCVLPFFPPDQEQTICSDPNVVKNQKTYYSRYVQNEQTSLCEVPCMKMTANFGFVDTDSHELSSFYQSRSYVKIYLKSTVQYINTITDYPLTTMLGGIQVHTIKYICSN